MQFRYLLFQQINHRLLTFDEHIDSIAFYMALCILIIVTDVPNTLFEIFNVDGLQWRALFTFKMKGNCA